MVETGASANATPTVMILTLPRDKGRGHTAMFTMEMRVNGREVTSATQLERELKRSIEGHVHDRLKKAAGPGIRLKTTRDGYLAEGAPEQIERMKLRLRQHAL